MGSENAHASGSWESPMFFCLRIFSVRQSSFGRLIRHSATGCFDKQ